VGDSTLRLSLLGPPEAVCDGASLVVDTRKATALLAYLAVEEGRHGRDSLAALLWPEYAPDRARAALRRTLSTLRSALGGRWLAVARDAVSLDRDGLVLDVDEFRRLAAGDDLPGFFARSVVALLSRPGFGMTLAEIRPYSACTRSMWEALVSLPAEAGAPSR